MRNRTETSTPSVTISKTYQQLHITTVSPHYTAVIPCKEEMTYIPITAAAQWLKPKMINVTTSQEVVAHTKSKICLLAYGEQPASNTPPLTTVFPSISSKHEPPKIIFRLYTPCVMIVKAVITNFDTLQ
jgi:hypothetical protein